MKLPPAWLQSDDGTEGGLVAQDLPHYIHIHWLGLIRVNREYVTLILTVKNSYTALGHAQVGLLTEGFSAVYFVQGSLADSNLCSVSQ